MRTFGVEEELLLVAVPSLEPLPAGEAVAGPQSGETSSGHRVTVELQQEQIEVDNPPQTTLTGQFAAIRAGRALAEEAAGRAGGRVAALATAPGGTSLHLTPKARYERIGREFGVMALENLTNGFHVHVGVSSRDEAVTALDRIRIWLPPLLALSANSPYWQGVDTGYASYRHRVMSRWPVSGPPEVFGSAAGYDRHRDRLLGTQVPLDAGMIYYDARPSERYPTLEVRIADVCTDQAVAAVIAALVRALVETAVRESRRPPAEVPASELGVWTWLASRSGVAGRLIDPATGTPAPAADVLGRLLDAVRPVLVDYGEEGPVETVVAQVLRQGTGADLQRQAFAAHQDIRNVVAVALEATHCAPSLPSSG
ncbi:MAG: YbdK family carboxylate-amine ligase [Citricoccus sp.]|nr:YbdK family carboxylate-amine ligase [Citricoccus sp. WCRC_4]